MNASSMYLMQKWENSPNKKTHIPTEYSLVDYPKWIKEVLAKVENYEISFFDFFEQMKQFGNSWYIHYARELRKQRNFHYRRY